MMSPCRLAYTPILRFEPSDNVTSQQHSARQRAVLRTLLATGRQDESPTTRRLALCPVIASTKAFQISYHNYLLVSNRTHLLRLQYSI
jgi:hypothetical protein